MGAACLHHNRHQRNVYDLHNKDVDHLVNATAKSLWSSETDRTMGICLNATTLSTHFSKDVHNNGHVDNLQELRLEHERQHCAYLSLRRNWNVLHSDDELNLRHLHLLVRLGLQELKHVHNDRLLPFTSAPSPTRTTRKPTLGLPGAALD